MKGTASVPSFSFQGSNKTGWYLSNTNEMSATINGTQYVTINSSGVISNATWGGTTIGPTAGGTGLISYSTGDILYASATNTVSKLPIGTTGYFLGIQAGVPTWLPVGTPGSVASFSGGTTGLTPNTPTIGSITLAGTLNTTNGGTGLTSFTSGGAVYATSTSALATGTLPTTAGGTGLASFTSGGAVYASSTSALATGTLPTTAGGTGITSFTSGGAVYASSASTLSTGTLPIASGGTNSTATPTAGAVAYGTGTSISYSAAGTAGQYLVSGGTGVPTWQSLGPTLSTISFGSTGLTPSTPTSGAITVAGTLAASNGGTGLTSFTSGGAVYASSTSALTTGTLPATAGGTGLNSYTTGDILYATSASVVGKLADVAVGNVLLSGGVGAAPTYGKVDLTTTVTGTLPVANGGTGLSSTPANGQILIGNGTNYTAATLTAGAGISINNAVGSVTITCTVAVGAQGYVTQFLGPSGPPTFRSQGFGII